MNQVCAVAVFIVARNTCASDVASILVVSLENLYALVLKVRDPLGVTAYDALFFICGEVTLMQLTFFNDMSVTKILNLGCILLVSSWFLDSYALICLGLAWLCHISVNSGFVAFFS